jgi:TP901 family phage tail tape measure protein
MAIKLYELGFYLKAIDAFSGTFHKAMANIEGLNAAAETASSSGLQKAAATMGKVGLAGLAAGGAVAYGLAKLVGPAIEASGELAHLGTAMKDDNDRAQNLIPTSLKLIEIAKKHAESIDSLRAAQYDALSTNLDNAQSLAAVSAATNLATATATNLNEAQANLAPTTRLLGGIFQNLGNSAKDPIPQMQMYADQLAVMQSSQAFHTLEELNDAMKYAAPLSAVNTISFTDQNTALSILSAGMKHGEQAGTSYVEMITALVNHAKAAAYAVRNSAGGLDIGASMLKLKAATAGLDGIQRAQFLHNLGFQSRSIEGVGILINKTDQYAATYERLEHSQGAAAKLAAIREKGADFQLGIFANNWKILREEMGETLLPAVNYLLPRLTAFLQRMHGLVEHHKAWVEWGLKIASIGAGLLIVGGALALVSSALLGFAAFVPVITAAVAVITFMLTPLGMLLTLATAVYLAFEHWGAIWNFLKSINWGQIGIDILKGIAQGLLNGIVYLTGPLGVVAKYILDHFKLHSPAKLGPLREFHNLRIVETIAAAIEPAPMLAAIRRVAAVTAIALPMAIGTAAMPAGAASPAGESGVAGIVVNLTMNYTMPSGASGEDFVKLAREHGREVAKIVEEILERKARVKF